MDTDDEDFIDDATDVPQAVAQFSPLPHRSPSPSDVESHSHLLPPGSSPSAEQESDQASADQEPPPSS